MFDMHFTLLRPVRPMNHRSNLAKALGVTEGALRQVVEDMDPDYETGNLDRIVRMIRLTDELGAECSLSRAKQLANAETHDIAAAIELYPGVERMLGDLRKMGIRTAICSNANIDTGYLLAKSKGLLGMVDVAVFSHQVGVQKPKPEIYEVALNSLSVSASEVLFVGDGGTNELKGAKDLGLRTYLAVQNDVVHMPGTHLDADMRGRIAEVAERLKTVNQ